MQNTHEKQNKKHHKKASPMLLGCTDLRHSLECLETYNLETGT